MQTRLNNETEKKNDNVNVMLLTVSLSAGHSKSYWQHLEITTEASNDKLTQLENEFEIAIFSKLVLLSVLL